MEIIFPLKYLSENMQIYATSLGVMAYIHEDYLCPDARDSLIWGRASHYEKMPVLMTGIYFNFTTSLSMCGPPAFEF